MTENEHNKITEKIIGCAYMVSNTRGSGFLEKVYKNSLRIELRKAEFYAERQVSIKVYYENLIVGVYFADILVENEIIIELKTSKHINVHI